MASGRAARREAHQLRVACVGIALACGLSACSSSPRQSAQVGNVPTLDVAARDYRVPGSSDDPWGPYIQEASERFNVPELWIREVMRQESGGRQFINGKPTTSPKGAAGLMQVMPATYAELRYKYDLGDDRYDPRNNILAGTAYIREMYDLYGYPAFLAAYNAGPGRLERHLFDGTPLPAETTNYLASVAPRLAGSAEAWGPLSNYASLTPERSADDLNRKALAALPGAAAPRTTVARATPARATPAAVQVASADRAYTAPARRSGGSAGGSGSATTADLNRRSAAGDTPQRAPVVLASAAPAPSTPAPAPRPAPAPAPIVTAAPAPAPAPVRTPPATPAPTLVASAPAESPRAAAKGTIVTASFLPTGAPATPVSARSVTAMSATQLSAALAAPAAPTRTASAAPSNGGPGIQVGAFSSPALAEAAAETARGKAGALLSAGRPVVSPVTRGDGSVLYRAWLVGLSADHAGAACDTLSRQGVACMVLSGDRMA